jgi:hypothetical protein
VRRRHHLTSKLHMLLRTRSMCGVCLFASSPQACTAISPVDAWSAILGFPTGLPGRQLAWRYLRYSSQMRKRLRLGRTAKHVGSRRQGHAVEHHSVPVRNESVRSGEGIRYRLPGPCQRGSLLQHRVGWRPTDGNVRRGKTEGNRGISGYRYLDWHGI